MRKFIIMAGQQLVYIVLPFALCLVARADAQPAQISEIEPSRGELLAKIHWLENRVQVLEARVQELEHPAPDTSSKPTNPNAPRLFTNPALAKPSVRDCVPPYTLDPQGLRHFLPECVGPSSNTCEQPFTIDAAGIKRVKLGCLTQ